jgi:hypothetical protein
MYYPMPAADLVPYAGASGTLGAGPYNLSASYIAGCSTTLEALGCPVTEAVNMGSPPFACTCGSFDASNRVSEDLLDCVMSSFMAALAAAAAAARAAAGCPASSTIGVSKAYIIAVAVLGSVVLLSLLVAVYATARCIARRRQDSAVSTEWTDSWKLLPAADHPASIRSAAP